LSGTAQTNFFDPKFLIWRLSEAYGTVPGVKWGKAS